MFLEIPHAVSGFYGTVVKKSEGEIFNSTDKLIMYYVSALTLYKLEYYFKSGTLDSKYRRAKNHMLMLFKIIIFNNDIPKFNSADMERKCQEMLKVLEENNTAIFEDIINVIRDNSEKFDMTDRKLFERKETTDNLKEAITPIIEKYNSANPETRAKTKQISLFD